MIIKDDFSFADVLIWNFTILKTRRLIRACKERKVVGTAFLDAFTFNCDDDGRRKLVDIFLKPKELAYRILGCKNRSRRKFEGMLRKISAKRRKNLPDLRIQILGSLRF